MTEKELNQLERLLAILSLGLCAAIKNQVIDIEEAEQFLYSPFMIKKLLEIGGDKKIIEIIQAGTELEDLESLLPNELAKSLSQMEKQALQFLTASTKTNPQLEKWLSQFFKEKEISKPREPLQLVG